MALHCKSIFFYHLILNYFSMKQIMEVFCLQLFEFFFQMRSSFMSNFFSKKCYREPFVDSYLHVLQLIYSLEFEC